MLPVAHARDRLVGGTQPPGVGTVLSETMVVDGMGDRIGGDAGGTDDLDSNLALMMTPSMRTQYERAVLEAMRQAGVGPDDPVMLVGFSQGGIMAGTLAAYHSEYTWSAAVVSGAPIDHLPIPATTTVVSVRRRSGADARHGGDRRGQRGYGGYGLPRNNEHWMTIRDDVPTATTCRPRRASRTSTTPTSIR